MRTHCKNGHEYTEGNFYLRYRAKGDTRKLYRACRVCRRFQEKLARVYGKERPRLPMTEEHAAIVLAELAAGRTLESICHGEAGKPAVVYMERVSAYRKANPQYEAQVQAAMRAGRKKRHADRLAEAEGALGARRDGRGPGHRSDRPPPWLHQPGGQ